MLLISRCDICYGGSTNLTIETGMDKCGRCIISSEKINEPSNSKLTLPFQHSRNKRNLSQLTNPKSEYEGCPCSAEEERDACGVCQKIGSKSNNGNSVINTKWNRVFVYQNDVN